MWPMSTTVHRAPNEQTKLLQNFTFNFSLSIHSVNILVNHMYVFIFV